MLELIFKDNKAGIGLHHAYLLVGNRSQSLKELRRHLASDWVYQEVETYGIDDSRQLRQWQQMSALGATDSGDRAQRFFIISFQFITPEAQNALLKTLEEPVPGHHFFILVEGTKNLLPTMLSRLQVLGSGFKGAEADEVSVNWAENFFKTDYEGRLRLVADYLDKIGSTSGAAAKFGALALVNALESKLYLGLKDRLNDREITRALKTLLVNRDYLHDQAALPKMVLEHLALTLPLT